MTHPRWLPVVIVNRFVATGGQRSLATQSVLGRIQVPECFRDGHGGVGERWSGGVVLQLRFPLLGFFAHGFNPIATLAFLC
jgi:hypothetical protein